MVAKERGITENYFYLRFLRGLRETSQIGPRSQLRLEVPHGSRILGGEDSNVRDSIMRPIGEPT
jgi:hypothetical protein